MVGVRVREDAVGAVERVVVGSEGFAYARELVVEGLAVDAPPAPAPATAGDAAAAGIGG